MTTYTINNRPKLLAPGDEIIFTVNGKTFTYYPFPNGRWIASNSGNNFKIFAELSLDKMRFASSAYGYEAGYGDCPTASSRGDFPALTRLVNAIYDYIASLEPERPCKDCPLKEEPKRALEPMDGEWFVPSESLELVPAEEPKQPALLSAGTWVRIKGGRTGAFREIVRIISVDNSDPIAPYGVKDARGETFWKCIDWVEPVENWERFRVGDYVKGKGRSGRFYTGRITEIDRLAKNSSHIRLVAENFPALPWLEDSSVEFAEPPEAKEDHSFQPGDPVRLIKGTYLPSGTTGTVLGEAEDDGYLVRWNEPDGPHRRWGHRNQIEHYQA